MARTGKLDLRVFQEELAARLASKTAAQVESSRLGLSAGGMQWLVRLADAGEVIPMPPLAAVPLTKPWFLGVANVRGNLYSVADFARFIGGGEDPGAHAGGAQARLLLFGPRAGDVRAGIAVPRVLGLRNLAELARTLPPADAKPWQGARWIDADGAAWQEIDLVRLAQDPSFLQVGV